MAFEKSYDCYMSLCVRTIDFEDYLKGQQRSRNKQKRGSRKNSVVNKKYELLLNIDYLLESPSSFYLHHSVRESLKDKMGFLPDTTQTKHTVD